VANTMKNSYRLFYQDIEMGEVVETDYDFPNSFGTFQPKDLGHDPLCQHLQNYIAYSIAADILMESGKEDGWQKFMEENEAQFLDLIETEDWRLDGDQTVSILIPNFCQNNEIVWRWNFSTSE
jgi:hypothetical protein